MRNTSRVIRAAWVVSVCLAMAWGGMAWAAGDDDDSPFAKSPKAKAGEKPAAGDDEDSPFKKNPDDGPLVKPEKDPAPTTKPTTRPAKPGKKPAPKKPKKPKSRIPEGDPWLESPAGNTSLSGLLLGVPLSKDDLYGQVVAVAYFSQSAKEMDKVLPFLVGMDRRYKSRGLVMIGSTRVHRDRDKAVTNMKQRGVGFAVYNSVSVPSDKVFDKTPYFFVLAHTGKVVYQGPPSSRIARAVSSAIARRPHPILGDGKFPRVRAVVTKIKANRLGDATTLAEKLKGTQGDVAAQAAELLARMDRYAAQELAKADRLVKRYPREAIEIYTRLKKHYGESPHGEAAAAKLKELSENTALQNELKAEKACMPIMQALATVSRFPYDGKPSQQQSWVQKYGGLLKGAKARLKVIEKKYPDTKAFKQADRMLKDVWPEKPAR